jgi:hypothetical protein
MSDLKDELLFELLQVKMVSIAENLAEYKKLGMLF